jgi:Zn-dependent protease
MVTAVLPIRFRPSLTTRMTGTSSRDLRVEANPEVLAVTHCPKTVAGRRMARMGNTTAAAIGSYDRQMQPNNRPRISRQPALLRVGRFFGVPVYFAPSWILIAALFTALYGSVVRDLVTGLSTAGAYLAAFAFAVLLAGCVLLHELGHTAVSLALGKPVRRVVIFVLGGVSELVDQIERARDELLISLAGPVVSALIAGLAAAGAGFAPEHSLVWALLILLAWSNVAVAVFNMLPGLPLDGGRVLRAVTWALSRSQLLGTRVAAWAGRVVAIAMVVGTTFLLRVGWGIGLWVLGLFMAAIVWGGATQALRAAAINDRLATLRVGDLLRPGLLVHADISVAEAVRRTREYGARGIVVTDSADRPQAIVAEARVRELPVERQPWTNISEVARALEPGLLLPDSLEGGALMEALQATPASEYLIMRRDGTLAGILAATDLAAALSTG